MPWYIRDWDWEKISTRWKRTSNSNFVVLCGSDIRFKIMCKISSISGLISHYFTHFLFSLKTPFQTLSAFPIFFGRLDAHPRRNKFPIKFVYLLKSVARTFHKSEIEKKLEKIKKRSKIKNAPKYSNMNPLGTRNKINSKLETWRMEIHLQCWIRLCSFLIEVHVSYHPQSTKLFTCIANKKVQRR